MLFKEHRQTLAMLFSFCYFGMTLTATDNNWPAVIGNLQKVRRIWALLSQILGLQGAYAQNSGMFYLKVLQSMLLFDSKIRVATPCMAKTMGGFHRRLAREITGQLPHQQVRKS